MNPIRSLSAALLLTVSAAGAEGVICAQGGRHAGWALYCSRGVLTYCHNIGAPPQHAAPDHQ